MVAHEVSRRIGAIRKNRFMLYIFLKINKKHAEIKCAIVNPLFLGMALLQSLIAINQPLILPEFSQHGFSVHIKREDMLHPLASGNKWRKLKYNIEAFKQSKANG